MGQRTNSVTTKEEVERPDPKAGAGATDGQEALQDQLESAKRQSDEYLALLRRTQADFENYQKRAQRESAEERRYANAALARELLPALDNLERAIKIARDEGEIGPLVEGVTLAQLHFLDVLRRFGVHSIEAQGQPFDPTLHEAVVHRATKDVEPGAVAEVLEKGYRLHDRLLRPAKVAVAAPPASS